MNTGHYNYWPYPVPSQRQNVLICRPVAMVLFKLFEIGGKQSLEPNSACHSLDKLAIHPWHRPHWVWHRLINVSAQSICAMHHGLLITLLWVFISRHVASITDVLIWKRIWWLQCAGCPSVKWAFSYRKMCVCRNNNNNDQLPNNYFLFFLLKS